MTVGEKIWGRRNLFQKLFLYSFRMFFSNYQSNRYEEGFLINKNSEDKQFENVWNGVRIKPRKLKMQKIKLDWKQFVIPLCLLVAFGIAYVSFFRHTETSRMHDFDPGISDKRKVSIYENMIDALRDENYGSSVGYRKRAETNHIQCGRVLSGDTEYINTLVGENRIPLIENRLLNMSCPAIRDRIHPKNRDFKLLDSGIAFARIVYTDYEFIEKQLEMSWHPQNVFCFTVDKKSPDEFISKMQKLDECLENVKVLPVVENYDSSGHNMNVGHKRCMKALLPNTDWYYILLLQNHDVIVKSVYEISRIYSLLGGVNDVHFGKELDERRVPGLKWDPKSMHLFRNESGIDKKVLNEPMRVYSGAVQVSLSRAAVKWLIEDVDVSIAIEQFNRTEYGGDEQLIPSLYLNHEYGMPGHFTDQCIDYQGIDQITRFVQWVREGINGCPTKSFRHGVCLIGIEQFRALSRMPFITVNKMVPSFDYSIIECTSELLYNRTFLSQMDHELDESFYKELLHVKYHKHHKDPGYKLDCSSNQNPSKYEYYL
ncbi:hypothetical protein B9Z55_013662 [Caenorhabditis nigoni]|uniref:Uncharacterized protein n=1 Tax=Caenorhabditis nigoni TaxID=1611254 RepID=A0A2G5U2N1_9PELO|nr:hypothetical protein B9Z55_013662 [Caenorhabditis nigoni]